MESANGMSQGSDTAVSQSGSTASTGTPAQSAPATTHEERVFRQSDVNDIVKKAKYGAVEDYKRLQSEQPQYVQQKEAVRSEQPYSPPHSQNAGMPET